MRADLRKPFLSGRAMQRQQFQRRREFLRLQSPVRDQAGRADDQCRAVQPAFRLFDRQMRQGLHRLAQAHIVGQHAAEAGDAEKLQPGDALGLVRA